MKMTRSLLAVFALASSLVVGCSDSSSSSASESECAVTNGTVIVSPSAGDVFKVGETISVVFGSDIKENGFRIQYRTSADAQGKDLTEEAVGPENPDGKSCYEVKVTLDEDKEVEPSKEAVIRVIPYNDQAKGKNSEAFTVKE